MCRAALLCICALLLTVPARAAPALPESAGGDAAALRERAVRLEHGEGMARDLPQALALYCRAARMGDAAAQYGMGWMLANGRGAARDNGAAAQLFALAAAQGHPQARAMLPYLQAAPQTPLPPCMLPGLALPAPEPRSYYLQGPGKDVAVLVDHLAPEYDIDPRLAMAFIQIESSFNPQAVSPRQAQGLMQLIPATAARFRVRDSFNPEQNIRGGLAYLRWLLTYFEGDVRLVAAAYNAGEKAVERYRGVPPYAETRDYVAKIMALYRRDRHSYNARSQQRELSKNLTPHLPNDPRLPTSP